MPPLFGRMTEKKITATFPSSSAHVSPYNIQENVWRLGLCPRNRVGAHIAPHIVLFKELNKYNLGNWSLMFASVSGQMALATDDRLTLIADHIVMQYDRLKTNK